MLLCWRAPSLPRVRYKILPARLLGGENGTKLSLHVEKAPNRAISGEQGEFCTAHAVGRGVRGEFCPAHAVRGVCWESFVPHMRCEGCAGRVLYRKLGRAARAGRDLFRRGTFRVCSCRVSATHRCPILALGPCSALDTGSGGGFAPCEALWRRVAGVSHPCMAQFPPIGGGAAMVCSGVAPTSQTTSAKNLEIGLLVAKWSAFWRIRCLSWCGGRT